MEAEKTTIKEAPGEAPVEKFPELAAMTAALKEERENIIKTSAPFRAARESLLTEIQPLEAKLREIDANIKEIERPRLAQIDNQLGKLAIAMGGRRLSQPE